MAHSPNKPTQRFARRVDRIVLSATKQMPILAAKAGGCVSLGQGVPSFGTPPHVVRAVTRALVDDPSVGKYSLQPGLTELRRAISLNLMESKGLAYDPDSEISVTVGAMGALAQSFLALVQEGDEVILPEPVYASYIEQVQLAGASPVFAPLRANDWGLDLEGIKSAISPRTRLIVLCNPSNPTGGVYADDEIRAVAELAREAGIFLISDETYDYLTYGRPAPLSPAALPGMKDWTILINSFSKKYALTGWRAGYAAASAPVMEQLGKIQDATAICAPTPGQHAALAALTGPQDVVHEMTTALKRRRELACERLDGLKKWFGYVPPSGAFYIMARWRPGGMTSYELAVRLIKEAGVVTVPGESFGPSGQGHLRLSFGGEEAELNQAFDRLERWCRDFHS